MLQLQSNLAFDVLDMMFMEKVSSNSGASPPPQKEEALLPPSLSPPPPPPASGTTRTGFGTLQILCRSESTRKSPSKLTYQNEILGDKQLIHLSKKLNEKQEGETTRERAVRLEQGWEEEGEGGMGPFRSSNLSDVLRYST